MGRLVVLQMIRCGPTLPSELGNSNSTVNDPGTNKKHAENVLFTHLAKEHLTILNIIASHPKLFTNMPILLFYI